MQNSLMSWMLWASTLELTRKAVWIKNLRILTGKKHCQIKLHPVDTGRKLNVHKTFRRRPGRLLNVLCKFNLRPVSTGQHLQKVGIWAFESLVHQINSLEGVLKLKQNFQKNKLVTGKTSFFVIGLFCVHHSNCLNKWFLICQFCMDMMLFNLNAFN